MDRQVELRLSLAFALPASLALSFGFVGSLHLWRLCGYEDRNRDDTATIQRRFVSTSISCVLGFVLVCGLARPAGAAPDALPLTYGELLGLWTPQAWRACAQSLLAAALLFLGPLLQHALAVREGYALLVTVPDKHWIATRDVVMAPLTEEMFFRACLVRLWDAAGVSRELIIFAGPLCFALAHTHHFLELVRRHENKSAALAKVLFQVMYTSLFGMCVSFILLRTGSAWAAVVVHMFCNHQGFPDLSFVSEDDPLHPLRHLVLAAYLAGIAAFACALGPLTAGFEPLFRCMVPGAAQV